MRRAVLILAAVVSVGALTACETATPYQPIAPSNTQAGGYSETKIDTNRWRVTFSGNDLTSRQTVENYLLYHAAELTVAQGFDWFEPAYRSTDKHVDAYYPGPYYGWAPYWRFYGGPGFRGRWGPGPWGDPFWGDPWGPGGFPPEERYEASAEIVMGHGPKPADDRRALDAREVISNLSGKIVRPK